MEELAKNVRLEQKEHELQQLRIQYRQLGKEIQKLRDLQN